MCDDGELLFCGTGGQSAHWSLVDDVTDEEIKFMLGKGMSFQLIFFHWRKSTAATLDRILTSAADFFVFPFSIAPLLLSVQELALNGIKANMKKAAITSSSSPSAGLILFNNHLGKGGSLLATLARENQFWTAIVIKAQATRIRLDVINASPLLVDEENRIRDRLTLAKSYDTIDQFHQEAGDITEGAGLGLYLVDLSLKSIDVRLRRLRIRSDRRGHTVARVSLAWDTLVNQTLAP